MKNSEIDRLLSIMADLRDPIIGCPWDKKQTLESIIPHSIEEVYEVADQIYNKNYEKLKEELGDLLFQVVYLSQIAKEKNKFNFNDVVISIRKKMIDRHPHVFANKKFKNIEEFKNWWEESKNKRNNSILDDIPKNYPALIYANKIQKKVASAGFDYSSDIQSLDKVIEESKELKKEMKNRNYKKIQEELGDLIFACLDVSRKLGYSPEVILAKTNKKFIKRWKFIEQKIKKDKKSLTSVKLKEFDHYWKLSKRK